MDSTSVNIRYPVWIRRSHIDSFRTQWDETIQLLSELGVQGGHVVPTGQESPTLYAHLTFCDLPCWESFRDYAPNPVKGVSDEMEHSAIYGFLEGEVVAATTPNASKSTL